ncbi:MAG: MerR family transcriptional regulator [Enterococcus sp.]
MEYTTQQLAQLTNISSRTLRYYDQIDLLKPKKTTASGYRFYGQAEVDRLQKILFLKCFGFSLTEIHQQLCQNEDQQIQTLKGQYQKLLAEKQELESLLTNLKKTINYYEGAEQMNDEEKFAVLKEQKLAENEELFGSELRAKYDATTLKKAQQKWQQLTLEQFTAMTQAEETLIRTLNQLLTTPQAIPNELAKQAFIAHKTWLSITAPFYSAEYHRNLAEMYVGDERFAQYYNEKTVSSSVELLKEIIDYYTKTDEG